MDKKNTVIGVLLLLAAVVSFYLSARLAPQPPPKAPISATPTGSPIARNQAPPEGPAQTVPGATLSAPPKSTAPAEQVTLANDFIAVTFTTAGGAIDTVALKKHPAVLGKPAPYELNHPQAAPALSLVNFPGLDQDARYELVSRTTDEVVYHTVLDGKLEVTRRYKLLGGASGDPYQVRAETVFHNLTGETLPLSRISLNIGTASPLSENDSGLYLNMGLYNGDKVEFTRRDELAGGGFFTSSPPLPFLDKTAPVIWATIKNQFFASILTPDQPGAGVRIERVKVDPFRPADDRRAYGLTAAVQFDLKPLAAGASETWGATYYAGPKEYSRLAKTDNFHHNEDLVMEFGRFFGFFSKLLITIMTWIHGLLVGIAPKWAWGWSIVFTTLLLKTVFVPLTISASRSAKRMQKIMPLITEMREKYKDNPVKAQEQMMKMYKEYKVNPLGGCIPVLVTIPFFIGFFSMLQSAAELRFAPFLWAADLAAPDTVLSFGTVTLPLLGLTHLSLNILPLLMGATMIYQMRLQPTPTTDAAQAAMMKFMPLIYMFFCYSFASALSLYSFVNSLFTIGQQMVINRMPEPQLVPVASDSMKNVTPKKKK
jgi:YidC/Oxa1 family membrane protein insertase